MSDESRFRRTKIVATVGPSCESEEMLRRMIRAGVDVFRVNSSHGTLQSRAEYIERIDKVRREMDWPVAILVDLQGPRIRVGKLVEPRKLIEGKSVTFAPEEEATGDEIPTTYAQLADDVASGARILLDDGLLEARVEGVSGRRVQAIVVHGGVLKSNKGMNLPEVKVSAPAVTDKDLEDVKMAVELDVDFLGLSFVRRHEDVLLLREKIPRTIRIVSKIEKDTALDDLHNIMDATNAVMVARGDLGVELPFEQVPLAQKRIIGLANEFGRSVITATQMLESMVQNPRPTRAETSDVANAVLDGTDAVMLSAETAVGLYPVEAVEAMARIINTVELESGEGGAFGRARQRKFGEEGPDTADAIAKATCAAAEMLSVPLIVSFTASGFTARMISAYRPTVPVIGLTTERKTFYQLALQWGVVPLLASSVPTYEEMLGIARDLLIAENYVERGERVVVTAGVPFDVSGTTNLLKVEVV